MGKKKILVKGKIKKVKRGPEYSVRNPSEAKTKWHYSQGAGRKLRVWKSRIRTEKEIGIDGERRYY